MYAAVRGEAAVCSVDGTPPIGLGFRHDRFPPPERLSDRVSVSRIDATASSFVEPTVIVAGHAFHLPSSLICVQPRLPDSLTVDCVLHSTLRQQRTEVQGGSVLAAHLGCCQRHLRFRLPSRSLFVVVGVGVGVGIKRTVSIFLRPISIRESTDCGPLPHPSHAGRAHRPCTHSYPSVPVCPWCQPQFSFQEGTAAAGSGQRQRQRQRHRPHDPWRSCIRTSFPAILPICSRVLTIPLWMGYTRLSTSCLSLASIFCPPSSCPARLRE